MGAVYDRYYEVVDKCIRCVMLTEVSDYLYSIRRGDESR